MIAPITRVIIMLVSVSVVVMMMMNMLDDLWLDLLLFGESLNNPLLPNDFSINSPPQNPHTVGVFCMIHLEVFSLIVINLRFTKINQR